MKRCLICNRELKNAKSMKNGVGAECLSKNLRELSDKQKTAFANGLKNEFIDEFQSAKFEVYEDFISIDFAGADRVVHLEDVKASEIRDLIEEELNDIIDNPDQNYQIKTLSKEMMDEKLKSLVLSDRKTEDSPFVKSMMKKFHDLEDKKNKD